MPLTVVVVGAGICGLTTALAMQSKGFQVTVLERTPGVQHIGGPLSIRPAAIRLLRPLGLIDALEKNSEPAISNWHFRRYSTGEIIKAIDVVTASKDAFGDQSLGFARQALHNTLLEATLKRNIEVKYASKVVGVEDGETPTLKLEDGRVVTADVIVGADGINSTIRKSILPPDPERVKSFLSAYMLKVPLAAVKKDPEMASYLPSAHWWFGPGRLAIATKMETVDAVDLHFYLEKERGIPGVSEKGSIEEVKEYFKDFDPILFKLLELAPKDDCYIWNISGLSPLPTWVSKGGRIVVIGDAAHAMVPYLGQGASQAIEDAVVLAECLSRTNADVGGSGDIGKILNVFEKIRKPRGEATVAYSRHQLSIAHFPDGPMQEARDAKMKEVGTSFTRPAEWDGDQILEPPAIGHLLVDPYLMGYDALAHTKKVLDQELAVA